MQLEPVLTSIIDTGRLLPTPAGLRTEGSRVGEAIVGPVVVAKKLDGECQ